jgi:hypothetical protein
MSSDFGGAGVIKGQIGTLYGIPVVVSTNCPELESGVNKLGLLMHKDAIVFAEQQGVRSQTQYKQEYLSTLFTSDTIYGIDTIRAENGIGLVLPA